MVPTFASPTGADGSEEGGHKAVQVHSVAEVFSLLHHSRLFRPGEVAEIRQRWSKETGEQTDDPEALVKWLVARRYLTEYQGRLVLRGKSGHYYLNEYKIVDRIGQGDLAGVYKAVHRLGETVALKVLPPSKAKDAESFARFQREAHLAVKLQHPHVLRTLGVGEEDGLHFLVMEYLDGVTLDQALEKHHGVVSPAEAIPLIQQALDALQYLHEQGIVHRDLVPNNLMLLTHAPTTHAPLARTTLKVIDIGLGRALFDDDSWKREGTHRTTEGTILGNADYMAPEQARDAHAVDTRADIYSLGCVLYRMLAGQVPFPGGNTVQKLVRHATETPRRLREFNDEVSDQLQAVVDRMMAKDLAQRYATPDEAALELGGLYGGLRRAHMEKRAQAFLKSLGRDRSRVSADQSNKMEAQGVSGPPPLPVVQAPVATPVQQEKANEDSDPWNIRWRDVICFVLGLAGGLGAVLLAQGLMHMLGS